MSKLGLALGGGGARGLAHIGVLKVLDAEKIRISAITGCSMGALVGGLYAYYGNAIQVEEFILRIIRDPKFIRLGIDKLNEKPKQRDKNYFEQFVDFVGTRLQALKSLSRLSYFDESITGEFYGIIPDVSIETLGVTFSAIATDLLSGEEITFAEGSLRKAIRASSAIPGIFPPVKYDPYLLVDGSASESVPAGKVKDLGADRVVAVDVTRCLKVVGHTKNILDILYRTEDITSFHLSMVRLKEADMIIRPQVRELSWADFDKVEEIIAAGEIAARKSLRDIKRLAHRSSLLLEIDHFIQRLQRDR